MVRTHPSLVPWWHISHGRVSTIQMPMEVAVIARGYASPSGSILTGAEGTCCSPCTFGRRSYRNQVRWERRSATSVTQNGITVPVLQSIRLTILQLSISAVDAVSCSTGVAGVLTYFNRGTLTSELST
jgi:hypothetical protein